MNNTNHQFAASGLVAHQPAPKAESVQERLERLSILLNAAHDDQCGLFTRLQDVIRPRPPTTAAEGKLLESVPTSQCQLADTIESLIERVAGMRRDLASALERLEV